MSRPPLALVGERLAAISAYRTRPDPAPIKLDANESPWPLPERARARLARVLGDAPLHRYPDLLARDVRRLIAARIGSSPDELVLGVGSDEIIAFLFTALDRPRPSARQASVVSAAPSFTMVPITARVHGLRPVEVPLADDFSLDADAMIAAIREHRPNLVYLATPNNPTGNAFAEEAVLAIVNAAHDALVIIDEAYADFAGRSFASLFDRHANVAMLGTLSKIGLAGIRLGWARLRPELAVEVEKVRPPFNLNVYTQLAARVILEEMPELLDDQITSIVRERERVGAALAALGLRVFPSSANFFLVATDDPTRIDAALLSRGVSVRRFASEPRLARHLRITIGTPEENDALLDALRAALG
jgi:histidinol-phosphate aminotransferase